MPPMALTEAEQGRVLPFRLQIRTSNIVQQEANRSREVSRTRTLLDAPSSSLAVFDDDTLGDDLANAMDEDLEPDDSVMGHISFET